MDHVYQLNCPLVDMSPIAVEPDFTRKYLQSSNNEALVRKIQKAFDRVAWEKDFVLCEGSGHAGVGAVFDLSNAQVAKILHAKVIIVTQGGIGKPIDEVSLNQALFEKEDVEIIGVILNKVLPDKVDYVTEFARRGLKRKGLELLGVIPHQSILTNPTLDQVRDGLKAEMLNNSKQLQNRVNTVVVGSITTANAPSFLPSNALLITPGDGDSQIVAAATTAHAVLAGIVLTGNVRPGGDVLKLIQEMPFPVLLAREDSYHVASTVHDLTVKTRPNDTEKISLIRDLIAEYVDVNKILKAL
jgi:hypothetical protein